MLPVRSYCAGAAALLFGLSIVLFNLAGCSGNSGQVSVAGSVTFDGQPVQQGEIIFTPADGEQGSVASPIVDGKYELAVPPGRHQIRITAYRDTGKVDRSNPGQEAPLLEMYIPEKYNSRTTLEATVDKANPALDFPLTTAG